MAEKFSITEVVSKNFVIDGFQEIRNIIGLNLKGYERKINETTNKLINNATNKYGELKWFRMQINQLDNKAVMITVYGESVK